MTATTPLVAANVATSNPNASIGAPTAYSLVAGDVSSGLSIPASLFSGINAGLNYKQAGFLPERIRLVVNTTTAGTAFSIVVKATQPQTDVPHEAVPFPSANAGDLTFNVNTVGVYYLGPFTSAQIMQPDGSILLNFTGTLGVTTIAILNQAYAPAGPRG
ncbi:MAG: hypothetical protein YHS30scaffold324_8 [Catenulispora phage 69_17]|jgi:hypothetical protein|nr:MAG: hypothetical protein YHS30scaffold324_8 [Catenulispora phage 69_17]